MQELLVTSSFLFLVVMPGATSSDALVTSSDALYKMLKKPHKRATA